MSPKAAPVSIDEYITLFPPEVRAILEKIRTVIRKAAPDAEETISYRIPAFTQGGVFLFFAAFKKHIGIYPPVAEDSSLRRDLKPYEGPNRNLQIPFGASFPYDLIRRVAECRLAEHLENVARRKTRSGKAKIGTSSGQDPKAVFPGYPEFAASRRKILALIKKLPEAEAIPQGKGHLSLEVRRKRFGWYMESHHGDGRCAVNCKAQPGAGTSLKKQAPTSFHVPKYAGHRGWIGLWLDVPKLDWEVVARALTDACQMTAPKKPRTKR